MSNIAVCSAMESLCLERAKADPARAAKWLGQADRWHDLGKQESAWRFQRTNKQQQMHAGPMTMGPNPVSGQLRSRQQG
jgi:hypothetical protein